MVHTFLGTVTTQKCNRCLHGCTTIASVFLSLIGENNLLQSNNKTECNQMSLWSVTLQLCQIRIIGFIKCWENLGAT